AEFARDEEILQQALRLPNMSKQTANLMSFLPLHVGMRCKMTKKIMAPELAQECPCEVLQINFHPDERLDCVPQSILRIEDSAEKRRGIWHLEPTSDDFTTSVRRGGQFWVNVTRAQFGLAPSKAGTYNNLQGKTIREADGTPLGHRIDFTKPHYFNEDEYMQHVSMTLGRARSLRWSLFRNLPTTSDGDVDFTVFENGLLVLPLSVVDNNFVFFLVQKIFHDLSLGNRPSGTASASLELAKKRVRDAALMTDDAFFSAHG
ncbi:unnamed protein product, partial [Symbiodinium pilosum]